GSVAAQFRMTLSTTLFRISSSPIDRATETESPGVAFSRRAATASARSRASPVSVAIQREASGQFVSTQLLAIVLMTFVCSFAGNEATQFAADRGSFSAHKEANVHSASLRGSPAGMWPIQSLVSSTFWPNVVVTTVYALYAMLGSFMCCAT